MALETGRADLRIGHESKAEAQKFQDRCLSSSATPNEAVQAIGEFQLHAGQKTTRNFEVQHRMVGGHFCFRPLVVLASLFSWVI